MNNRCLVTIIMLLMPVLQTVADTYKVFSVNGDVTFERVDIQLRHNDRLKLTDKLNLGENACISVLNENNRRIYKSCGPMQGVSVARIVAEAKREADKSLSVINRGLSKNDSKTKGKRRMGASFRGAETDSINHMLASAVLFSLTDRKTSDSLKAKRVDNGDGSFHFKISNLSSDTLYANVLRLTNTRPELCFDINTSTGDPYIILYPQTDTSLNNYIFAIDEYSTTIGYVVFASCFPFDSNALNLLFSDSQILPSAKSIEKIRLSPLF